MSHRYRRFSLPVLFLRLVLILPLLRTNSVLYCPPFIQSPTCLSESHPISSFPSPAISTLFPYIRAKPTLQVTERIALYENRPHFSLATLLLPQIAVPNGKGDPIWRPNVYLTKKAINHDCFRDMLSLSQQNELHCSRFHEPSLLQWA